MQLRNRYLSWILAIAVGFTAGVLIEAQKPNDPTPKASPTPSPRPSYNPNSRQVLLADVTESDEGTTEDEEEDDGNDDDREPRTFGDEVYA